MKPPKRQQKCLHKSTGDKTQPAGGDGGKLRDQGTTRESRERRPTADGGFGNGGWMVWTGVDGWDGGTRQLPSLSHFFFFPFLFFFFFLPVPMEGGDHFRWRIQVAKAWGRLRRRPTTAVAQDRDSGDGKGEPRKRRYGSQAVESSFRVSCGCTPQNPTAPHWHGRRLPDLSSRRRFCGEERGLRENLQRNATLSWTETAPPPARIHRNFPDELHARPDFFPRSSQWARARKSQGTRDGKAVIVGASVPD